MNSYVYYSFKIKNLHVVTATEITGRLSSRAGASLARECTKGEGVEDGPAAVVTTEIGQHLGERRELGKRVLSLGGCPSITFYLLLHGP